MDNTRKVTDIISSVVHMDNDRIVEYHFDYV